MLFTAIDTTLPIPLPRQRYQEILADVLEEVPFKVLQDAGDFGDVSSQYKI